MFVFQDVQFCSPITFDCYTAVFEDNCGVSCSGLYADIAFFDDYFLKTTTDFSVTMYGDKYPVDSVHHNKERQRLRQLLEKYTEYKSNFVKPMKFDSKLSNLSK